MSKRNSDGDVVGNRFRLTLANSQRRLAAMLGPQPESHATPSNTTTADGGEDADKNENDDEDVKQSFVEPEFLGYGSIPPQKFQDDSFIGRKTTLDDKLLEQLIGKKKTKAHLAAKQQSARLGGQQQPKHNKHPVAKKEESEDEEEGRAAAFTSKRRKSSKSKPVPVTDAEDQDELQAEGTNGGENVESEGSAAALPAENDNDDEKGPVVERQSVPSRGKPKPKSFLDEILAERSKKKKKKHGNGLES